MSDATKALASITPKIRKQLHQSGLEMFNLCGERFRYRYIEGIRRPPASYMLCGTATDKAVNSDLDQKIVTGDLLPLDIVQDIARDSVEGHRDARNIQLEGEELGKSLNDVLGATKDKAVRLVTTHHGDAAPNLHPYRTARKFSVNLDKLLRQRAAGLHEQEDHMEGWEKRITRRQAEALNAAARDGWDLVGEQDLVEGEALADKLDVSKPFSIRDLKTSKKTPSKDVAADSEQLSVYSIASWVIDGRLPDFVALDYLVDLKGGVKYAIAKSHRTEGDITPTLERIAVSISSIQQGIFVPTPQTSWQCDPRYCGYTDRCKYFKHTKSVVLKGNLEGTADNTKPSLVQIKEANVNTGDSTHQAGT